MKYLEKLNNEQLIRSRKFYGSSDWRKLRDIKIQQQPLCEHCLQEGKIVIAKEVDHKEPITVNWNRRLNLTNLQSLCPPCHGRKSHQENYEKIHNKAKPVNPMDDILNDILND